LQKNKQTNKQAKMIRKANYEQKTFDCETRYNNNNNNNNKWGLQHKHSAGKYSIHDISNEYGNLLGQFVTRIALKIKKYNLPV
jgi:hypothetical protein